MPRTLYVPPFTIPPRSLCDFCSVPLTPGVAEEEGCIRVAEMIAVAGTVFEPDHWGFCKACWTVVQAFPEVDLRAYAMKVADGSPGLAMIYASVWEKVITLGVKHKTGPECIADRFEGDNDDRFPKDSHGVGDR